MKNTQMTLTRIPKTGINTVVVDSLPNDVPAIVSKNQDETYTIALNNSYTFERLQQEYLHELKHIAEKHHDLKTADEAEKRVRTDKEIGFTPISKFPYSLIQALTKEYLQLHPRPKETDKLTAADYYPPGAYEDMKQRRWI